MLLRRALAIAAFAALGLLAATVPSQTSTNLYWVQPGKPLAFEGDPRIDLSTEGSIEFWLKPEWNPGTFRWAADKRVLDLDKGTTFEQNDRPVDFALYSTVLAIGDPDKPAFVLWVNPRDDATMDQGSWLGIASSLDEVGLTPEEGVPTPRCIELKEGIKIRGQKPLHIVIVKRRDEDGVRVYVDEVPHRIPTTLGETAGQTIWLGWPFQPRTRKKDFGEHKTVYTQHKPLDAHIGGLRIYRRALSEPSIAALRTFGRPTDIQRLRLLKEYGDLVAYGDFNGKAWNAYEGVEDADLPPLLKLADPLAGTWRISNTSPREIGGRQRAPDVPVITLVPQTTTARAADRVYQVFQNTDYVGRFVFKTQRGRKEEWWFEPLGGESKVTFEHSRVDSDDRPRWKLACEGLPAELAGFAGTAGFDASNPRKSERVPSFTLERYGLSVEFLAPLTKNEWTSKEKEFRTGEKLGASFLFSALINNWAPLYKGYNLARMPGLVKSSGTGLFDTGLKADAQAILRGPEFTELDQFLMHTDQGVLVPYNLRIHPKLSGGVDKEQVLISSSQEHAMMRTNRVGAGLAVPLKGGMLQQIASYNTAKTKEDVLMTGREETSVITNSWDFKYMLRHDRDLMAVTPAFWEKMQELARTTRDNPGDQTPFRHFFDAWGTHFPLAITYGAVGKWRQTITKEDVSKAHNDSKSWELNVFEGTSGKETQVRNTFKKMLETTSAYGRAWGSSGGASSDTVTAVSAGDKPAPVFLDLRPIHELLSPQHFPESPAVYRELRQRMAAALPRYYVHLQEKALDELKNDKDLTKQDIERFRASLASIPVGRQTEPVTVQVRIDKIEFKGGPNTVRGGIWFFPTHPGASPMPGRDPERRWQGLVTEQGFEIPRRFVDRLIGNLGPRQIWSGRAQPVGRDGLGNKEPWMGSPVYERPVVGGLVGPRYLSRNMVSTAEGLPQILEFTVPGAFADIAQLGILFDLHMSSPVFEVFGQTSLPAAALKKMLKNKKPIKGGWIRLKGRQALGDTLISLTKKGATGTLGTKAVDISTPKGCDEKAGAWVARSAEFRMEPDVTNWKEWEVSFVPSKGAPTLVDEQRIRAHLSPPGSPADSMKKRFAGSPLDWAKPAGVKWAEERIRKRRTLFHLTREDKDKWRAYYKYNTRHTVTVSYSCRKVPALSDLLGVDHNASPALRVLPSSRRRSNNLTIGTPPEAADPWSVVRFNGVCRNVRRSASRPDTDPRIPFDATAYYPFDGNGDEQTGLSLRSVGIDAAQFASHALTRSSQGHVRVPRRGDGSFTIHMDFRVDEQPEFWSPLIRCPDTRFRVDLHKTGNVRIGTTPVAPAVYAQYSGVVGGWHKLICSVDVEAQKLRLWIDGNVQEVDFPRTIEYPHGIHRWYFADEGGRTIPGAVDEVIVFGRALSVAEMTELGKRSRLAPGQKPTKTDAATPTLAKLLGKAHLIEPELVQLRGLPTKIPLPADTATLSVPTAEFGHRGIVPRAPKDAVVDLPCRWRGIRTLKLRVKQSKGGRALLVNWKPEDQPRGWERERRATFGGNAKHTPLRIEARASSGRVLKVLHVVPQRLQLRWPTYPPLSGTWRGGRGRGTIRLVVTSRSVTAQLRGGLVYQGGWDAGRGTVELTPRRTDRDRFNPLKRNRRRDTRSLSGRILDSGRKIRFRTGETWTFQRPLPKSKPKPKSKSKPKSKPKPLLAGKWQNARDKLSAEMRVRGNRVSGRFLVKTRRSGTKVWIPFEGSFKRDQLTVKTKGPIAALRLTLEGKITNGGRKIRWKSGQTWTFVR